MSDRTAPSLVLGIGIVAIVTFCAARLPPAARSAHQSLSPIGDLMAGGGMTLPAMTAELNALIGLVIGGLALAAMLAILAAGWTDPYHGNGLV